MPFHTHWPIFAPQFTVLLTPKTNEYEKISFMHFHAFLPQQHSGVTLKNSFEVKKGAYLEIITSSN